MEEGGVRHGASWIEKVAHSGHFSKQMGRVKMEGVGGGGGGARGLAASLGCSFIIFIFGTRLHHRARVSLEFTRAWNSQSPAAQASHELGLQGLCHHV